MKKLIVALVFAGVSLYASAPHRCRSVPVVRSVPVYRVVKVRVPYRQCRVRRVPVRCGGMPVPAAALIGGVAGGVLGHQIGKGSGRDLATIGGAAAGALVGAEIARTHRRTCYERRRVCRTRYRIRRKRRLVHYRNIAWDRGRRIVRLSSRPLRRIRVNCPW